MEKLKFISRDQAFAIRTKFGTPVFVYDERSCIRFAEDALKAWLKEETRREGFLQCNQTQYKLLFYQAFWQVDLTIPDPCTD